MSLEEAFGKNLSELRKGAHLTQLELAEKLGYSDKSISKWEMGKGLPPLDVTSRIAAFFKVSIDSLIEEGGAKKSLENAPGGSKQQTNRIIIMAMIVCFVFFTAAAFFAYDLIFGEPPNPNLWTVFLWAIPASTLILTFVSYRFYHFSLPFWILLSITIWVSFIDLAVTFEVFLGQPIWYIVLVPVPLQIGILLAMRLK